MSACLLGVVFAQVMLRVTMLRFHGYNFSGTSKRHVLTTNFLLLIIFLPLVHKKSLRNKTCVIDGTGLLNSAF